MQVRYPVFCSGKCVGVFDSKDDVAKTVEATYSKVPSIAIEREETPTATKFVVKYREGNKRVWRVYTVYTARVYDRPDHF